MSIPVFNVQEAVALAQSGVGPELLNGTAISRAPYPELILVYTIRFSDNQQAVTGATRIKTESDGDISMLGTSFYNSDRRDLFKLKLPSSALREGKYATKFSILYPDAPNAEAVAEPFLRASIIGLALLNCQNIEYEDYDPNKGASKKKPSQNKRPRPPYLKYKILHITPGPFKKRKSKATNKEPDNGTRLHSVRGHFKTYTTMRPLFGHLVGTFWWGDCVRGNPAFGLLEKDYYVRIRPEVFQRRWSL